MRLQICGLVVLMSYSFVALNDENSLKSELSEFNLTYLLKLTRSEADILQVGRAHEYYQSTNLEPHPSPCRTNHLERNVPYIEKMATDPTFRSEK